MKTILILLCLAGIAVAGEPTFSGKQIEFSDIYITGAMTSPLSSHSEDVCVFIPGGDELFCVKGINGGETSLKTVSIHSKFQPIITYEKGEWVIVFIKGSAVIPGKQK